MKCYSYTIGTIIDISDNINEKYKFITIAKKPDDIYTYIKLVYSQETIILNHEYNEITVNDLKVGDVIYLRLYDGKNDSGYYMIVNVIKKNR